MAADFTIRGELVNLRTMVPEDVADYERWSDPGREAWKFDGPWFKDDLKHLLEGALKRLASGARPPYKRLEIEGNDAIHLGWCVFYGRVDDPHMCEVGIAIVEETHWGQGKGIEALKLWVDYLFRERNLTRLGFGTWSGNQRMIRLGQRLGFVQEGCIRNGCEVDGRFYDRIKMGILRSEFEAAGRRVVDKRVPAGADRPTEDLAETSKQ
jgi:RimJ/RimL family protein N-acetyltransferase